MGFRHFWSTRETLQQGTRRGVHGIKPRPHPIQEADLLPKEQRETILFKQRARQSTLITIVTDWKKTGCVECGFDKHPDALDAHHLDPQTKEAKINQMVTGSSPERLKQELSKCVCLCANCHRLVHAGIIVLTRKL